MTTKTLQQVFDACYDRRWANTASEKTVMTNGNYLLNLLGRTKLITGISTEDIDKLISTMELQGNTAATINRKLSLLSSVLTFAERRGYIKAKPFIDRKKVGEGRIHTLSRDDEGNILNYFREQGDDLMVDVCIVALDTGVRMGELLKLEPVLIQESCLYIPADIAKNNKARKIPYTARVRGVLFTRKETGLFTDLKYKELNYRWNKMKTQLGIENPLVVPHIMRHTFCSRLAEAGVSPWKIKELAGHSNLKQTERYTHIQDNGLNEAIQTLEI